MLRNPTGSPWQTRKGSELAAIECPCPAMLQVVVVTIHVRNIRRISTDLFAILETSSGFRSQHIRNSAQPNRSRLTVHSFSRFLRINRNAERRNDAEYPWQRRSLSLFLAGQPGGNPWSDLAAYNFNPMPTALFDWKDTTSGSYAPSERLTIKAGQQLNTPVILATAHTQPFWDFGFALLVQSLC